jgi:4'-phosphopantetheinyl transferase
VIAVELWRAPLDVAEDVFAELTATLAPAEHARAGALRGATERRRFLTDHGWRRRLLGERSGRAPEAIVFVAGGHGKPRLDGGGPRFSASRSGAIALYAVCELAEVGVDLEAVSRDGNLDRLAGRVLAPGERTRYESAPRSERPGALAACWTRKEAYLKALGTGLVFPLSDLELWAGDGRPVRRLGIEVHDVAPAGAGLAGAVAVALAPGHTVAIAAIAELGS